MRILGKELYDVYGNTCMSLRQVYRWVSGLKNGQKYLKNKQRLGASRTATKDAILEERKIISTNDGQLTIKNSKFSRHFTGDSINNFKETSWLPKGYCKIHKSSPNRKTKTIEG